MPASLETAFWEGQRSNRTQFSEAAVFGYIGRALCPALPGLGDSNTTNGLPRRSAENIKALLVTRIWKRIAWQADARLALERDLKYVAERARSDAVKNG